jgi:hypothetical protein
MTGEPSIFCTHGLGADVSGTDCLGAFKLHLTPNPSQMIPTSTPILPPCFYDNQTQLTVVEIKDLRQTVAIGIGYRDTECLDEMDKIFRPHIK